MERNKLLKLASTICNVFAGFQLIGIVLATVVLVHWHADKEFYRKVSITPGEGISFEISTTTTVTDGVNTTVKQKAPEVYVLSDGKEEVEKKYTLADLQPAAFYFSYVKGVLAMFFIFLTFKAFGNVVRSVSSFQTFRVANVQALRKVGKYMLIIFLISGPGFFAVEAAGTSKANISFDFDFEPLILMLVAYVLAEIFKEGNRLYEEEQLTV